jgi:phosphatidylserine/phosphatidylglycerophosphate/cardiolipin synthase-like enzyme
MTTTFHGPAPWPRIRELADGSKAHVAVPYLGKGAAALLPIAPGSVLVTRFTPDAVKSAQIDPREVVKLIDRGVRVFSDNTLHAKVYVFAKRAIIGSANVSRSSASLHEACIETTDPVAVLAARTFVKSLVSDLITPEYAKSLYDLYPKDGERFFGVRIGKTSTKAQARSKVWVVPVIDEEWSPEIRAADRLGSKQAKTEMKDASRGKLNKLHWESKVSFEPNDWVIWRYSRGGGYEFAPPSRIVYIHEVPDSHDHIVYGEQPKRTKSLPSKFVRLELADKADALTFKSDNHRLIRSASVAASALRLWPAFRGED